MQPEKKPYTNSDYVKFIAGSLKTISETLKHLIQSCDAIVHHLIQKKGDENDLKF